MAKEPHDPKRGDKQDEPEQRHGQQQQKPAAAPPRALEGTEVPDHLRQVQAQHQQQPPKPVKHEPAKDDLGQPVDGPPTPPAAKPEPVPRVIDQSERSPDPERLRRFKTRCDQPFGAQPVRYILARKGDKEGAIKHYLETTGLQAILDTFPDEQRPRPLMVCKELPD